MIASPLSSHFLTSTSQRPALAIGLLIDGTTLSRASASVVRDLQASNFARIALLLIDGSGAGSPPPQTGHRAARARFRRFRAEGGLAFAVWAMLDRRMNGKPDDPLELEDCAALLAGIPRLATAPIIAGSRTSLPADQIDAVRAKGLDVIVHLGDSRHPRGVAVLAAASRFGLWAFRHGDGDQYRGGPSGFWELVRGSPICGVAVVREADGASPRFSLDRAFFATDPPSLARTRRTAHFGSTHLLIRSLRLLHQRGWDWLDAHRLPDPVTGPPGSIDRRPTGWDVVRWFAPMALRKVVARLGRAVSKADDVLHWRIAMRTGGPPIGLDGPPDLSGFQWIEAPRGHYYADPFPVERDGRRWLFLEDYRYDRDAAVIGCMELGEDGRPGAFREVLRSAGHLSYPMIVRADGETLLIPESSAEGVVRAYRATTFPDQWEMAAELLDEAAVDTTVWYQDDRWWLFTTIYEPRGRAGMLMLFHADRIGGPWLSHPLNPISQDVRTNRGGGHLYLDRNRLVRPSQDGSRGYGYSLHLNEVTTLSPDDYAERRRVTITPDAVPGLLGLHTYNRLGDLEVLDGKVARPRRSVD